MHSNGKRPFSREELLKALSQDGEPVNPLEEVVASLKAVFAIVRLIEMEPRAKKVLAQYEKQFLQNVNLLKEKGILQEEKLKNNNDDDTTKFISLN